MKIAILYRSLDARGGGVRQLIFLARFLKEAGHTINFYTFFYDKQKCFPELIGDMPVVELPREYILPTGGFFGFVKETRMARKLAHFIDPATDFLNPHDAPMHHAALEFKKKIRNVPSVFQLNELPAMRWPPEMLRMVENRNFHSIPYRPLWLKKVKIYLRNRYEARVIQAQDLITVFDAYHKKLLKRFMNCASTIVPSGTDVSYLTQYTKAFPFRGERLLLLSSGIFASYRRFEDIISTLPVLKEKGYDPYLTILGDYTTDRKYLAALKEQTKTLGIKDRVRFFGRYTDAELNEFFKVSHIFVFPHLQSQGLSVNEALAAGLPVVISPFPGTYETLVDRRDALFVKPLDPSDLVQKILELLGNKELYQRLGEVGARTIRENYTWERYGREMLKIFEKVFKSANAVKHF